MSPETTTKSVSFDTRLMSLDLHLVSTVKTKVQQLDSHQIYITHMTLKISARQSETAARPFFATCAAAQHRGDIIGKVQYTMLSVSLSYRLVSHAIPQKDTHPDWRLQARSTLLSDGVSCRPWQTTQLTPGAFPADCVDTIECGKLQQSRSIECTKEERYGRNNMHSCSNEAEYTG